MVARALTPQEKVALDLEEGSAYDYDTLLFTSFDDGTVFSYDRSSVERLDEALQRDGKMRTLEQVLTLPQRQAPIAFRRGNAEREVTDWIAKVFTEPANNGGMTTPLKMIAAQMTGAIIYRKAFFEKVFTVNDEGRIVYKKVAWRPPATCAIMRDGEHGAFRGFKQQPVRLDYTEEITIPHNRAFVYIHGQHRNPLEGVSDFDVPYWCYVTKQKIRFLWYQFLEGQSLPKTVVRARDETSANKAAAKVVGLRQGGVVGLADGVTTDVLESSGKGATQFKEALQWLDAEASGAVLAGFTDLGAAATSGIGSFALSKDQTDFFLMSRQAVAQEMADSINQWLIPDLVRLNFGPGTASPLMEFGPIAEDDAQMAVSLLQATAVTQSPVLPREFMDELTERVAGFLGLNTARVRDGLARAAAETAQKASATVQPAIPGARVGSDLQRHAQGVGTVMGAVNAATNAVINKQIKDANPGSRA